MQSYVSRGNDAITTIRLLNCSLWSDLSMRLNYYVNGKLLAFSFAFCTLYKTGTPLLVPSPTPPYSYFHVPCYTIRCAMKYCVRSKHLWIRYTYSNALYNKLSFCPVFVATFSTSNFCVSDDSAVYGRKKWQKNHENFKYYKFNLPFANYKLIWKTFLFFRSAFVLSLHPSPSINVAFRVIFRNRVDVSKLYKLIKNYNERKTFSFCISLFPFSFSMKTYYFSRHSTAVRIFQRNCKNLMGEKKEWIRFNWISPLWRFISDNLVLRL